MTSICTLLHRAGLLFILAYALLSSQAVAQTPTPTPDEMFLKARSLAGEQRFEEARALCQEILQAHPEYHDATILMARTFAWQHDYLQAETLLKDLLTQAPDNQDAQKALADVLIWSGKFSEALPYIEKLLVDSPTNTGLLFNKALAKNGTGQADAAAVILSEILTIDPTHAPSQYLISELEAIRLRNFFAMGYRGDYFDASTPWHIFFLEIGRRTRNLGTIIPRVNIANRKGETGFLAEIDAYPILRQGTYMYLNMGYSPHTRLFPQFRVGAELFQRLSRAWEVSAGGRLLAFEDKELLIATGAVSFYFGQYLFTLRPFFAFSDYGFNSQSYFFSARRYFTSPVHHLTLTVGTGFAADEVALLGGEMYDIASNKILLQYQQKITPRMLVRLGAGFQQYPEGIWGNKYSIDAGVIYIF